MEFGIKLAEKLGFKSEYKRLRNLGRRFNYNLILFKDYDREESDLEFYVGELIQGNELMFITMSTQYDVVLRELSEYIDFYAKK